MKKVFIWIGAVFAAVAVALLCIFVIFGGDKADTTSFNINGTWMVLQRAGEYVNDTYLVFDDENFVKNENGTEEKIDTYTIDGFTITLSSGKQCSIKMISENNIVLTEKDSTIEWRVIRVNGVGIKATENNRKAIIGKWDVYMHGDKANSNNEVMVITENIFEDFRNNETNPFLSSPYVWTNDGMMNVEKAGMTLSVYPIGDDCILLLESSGTVWELRKK